MAKLGFSISVDKFKINKIRIRISVFLLSLFIVITYLCIYDFAGYVYFSVFHFQEKIKLLRRQRNCGIIIVFSSTTSVKTGTRS